MTRYPFLMNTITSSIQNEQFVSISPRLFLLKLCNCHVVYPLCQVGATRFAASNILSFNHSAQRHMREWMNEWLNGLNESERKMPTLMPTLFSTPGNLGPALLLFSNQREANSDKRSLQPPGICPAPEIPMKPPAGGAEKKQSNA